jgi:hypothetical protein
MRVALMASALSVPDACYTPADRLFALCGGNTGNFAFVFGLQQILSPDVDVVPWDIAPEMVKENYDVIVFACANQLGSHTDLQWMADRLAEMNRPIIAVGLGAQAKTTSHDVELTEGTRRWLDVIADHAPSSAPNIGVRGAYTLSQLERLGHDKRGTIIGCPSNFINPGAELGQAIAQRYQGAVDRVAVPAGLHYWPNLRQIEQCLADIVESSSGIYIAQSELDMVRLARDEADAIAPDVLEIMRNHIRPALDTSEFLRWIRRYAVTFVDAASWLDAMRKFDFVVGPRFHGVMLGIQAGIPGGVIAHDSRTFELCQTIGIPVRDYAEMPTRFTSNDIKALFPFDGSAYDRQRANLARALDNMLLRAGITLTAPNLAAIGSTPTTAAAA